MVDDSFLGGTLDVDYSNIQNGIDSIHVSAQSTLNWGDGNLDCDPLFVGTGDHPFSLQDGSVCINTGIPDTTGLHLPEMDLAGNPRVYGSRIEMGAYENQNVAVGTNNQAVVNSETFEVYPNPASGVTHLQYSISDIRYSIFELYTLAGVRIKTILYKIQQPGDYELEFDVTELPVGLYVIRRQAGNTFEVKKLVVIH